MSQPESIYQNTRHTREHHQEMPMDHETRKSKKSGVYKFLKYFVYFIILVIFLILVYSLVTGNSIYNGCSLTNSSSENNQCPKADKSKKDKCKKPKTKKSKKENCDLDSDSESESESESISISLSNCSTPHNMSHSSSCDSSSSSEDSSEECESEMECQVVPQHTMKFKKVVHKVPIWVPIQSEGCPPTHHRIAKPSSRKQRSQRNQQAKHIQEDSSWMVHDD